MPTVLIVDDDKHTRALLRTIFQQDPRFARHSLSVLEAGDGKEGLALYEKEKPAIVVTDLLMPKMDGFQMCAAIRKQPGGNDAGIIVVSGVYRDQNVAARVKTEFRASFFAKPYQLGDLASAVDQLLESPQKRASELSVPPVTVDVPASGSLVDTPLPRLLLDLWEKRSTGALEIKRAGLEKRIDLVVGHPVSVSSNQRSEALGEFLLARRIITPAQHQAALKLAHEEGAKLGETLIELGILTTAQLVKALTAQARAKIVSALRWSEGTWSYAPNRDLLDRHKGNALDPGAVVLLGLKQTGHLDDSIKAVDEIGGRPLVLTPRGEKLRAVIARAFGDKLLGALEKPASVATILESFPDAAQVMHALESLLRTGCLEARGGRTGNTILPSTRGGDPIALAGLSEAAGRKKRAPTEKPVATRSVSGSFQARPVTSPGAKVDTARDTIRTETVIDAEPAKLLPPAAAAARARALTPPAVAVVPATRPALARPVTGPLPTIGSAAAEARRVQALLNNLFNDEPSLPDDHAAVPQQIDAGDESGVIEVFGAAPGTRPGPHDVDAAREMLLAEYLRVQGPDLYEVLKVAPDADEAALETAYQARLFDFSLERFASLDLGPDHGKLEDIHAAYRRAHDTLTDASRRAEFDARQRTPTGGTPALAGELAFHEGEKKLADGDHEAAVHLFELASSQVPKAADYHAVLGWALYKRARALARGNPATIAEGAQAALARLDQALAIDPDNAHAHEYVGRILVDRGELSDDAARHLEAALAARPPRTEALLPLDRLRSQRNEYAALERQYRLLIHSLGEDDRALALRLWLALAELYRTRLADPTAARTALSAAARLAPDDASIPRALADLTAGQPELWQERAEALRARWRLDPGDIEAARELYTAARAHGDDDQAFVIAALLQIKEPDDAEAAAFYEQHRPRFLVRAVGAEGHALTLEEQPSLRHGEDNPDLASLFALVAELAEARAPVPMAQLQITPADRQADAELPEGFAKVRSWVAQVLAVPAPPVFVRADFDDQVHVAAPSDGIPMLLCGPRALAETDRLKLGFRLGRAMTYLWPGRAVAGSRPARRLRSMLLGCLAAGGFGAGGVALDPQDILAAESRAWLLGAPESRREDVRRLLTRLTTGKSNLNLSRWLQAMSHTADRVGLILCGDPAVALRGAESAGGPESAEALLDWARSSAHLAARIALGRSIAV